MITSKEVIWCGIKCTVEKASYQNGELALVLVASEGKADVFKGEMICRATLTVPGYPVPEGHCLIKDYGENAGLLTILVDLGILKDTGEKVPCGYVYAHLCEVLI